MGETEWDDELQRMRRIFAAAVEDTRLLIWEYDMAAHSIIATETRLGCGYSRQTPLRYP